jgi:hypothetical protein
MATHQQAAQRVDAGFWTHLASYLGVVSGLAIMNYQRNPNNPWVLWVAGGWGIGVAAHAAAYFTEQGRRRMIDRTEARMDRREDRRNERQERREAAGRR